jgi:hypothetical protein
MRLIHAPAGQLPAQVVELHGVVLTPKTPLRVVPTSITLHM